VTSSAAPVRTLAIAIGNSSLFAGVFEADSLAWSLRAPAGADPGGFVRRLRVRARGRIDAAALCSVVPGLTSAVAGAVRRAWGVTPRVLRAAGGHGLRIGYLKPSQLGADRVAAALGARAAFPGRNVIVVDFGTATTVTALSREGVVLGGAIIPGAALWSGMLSAKTAQLPRVALRRPEAALARSTADGMRSGIFHGHAGAVRELAGRIRAEAFGRADAVVVGTGGNAAPFAGEGLFAEIKPDLVLRGLLMFSASVHDSR